MLLNLCIMHLSTSPHGADAIEGGKKKKKHLLRLKVELQQEEGEMLRGKEGEWE